MKTIGWLMILLAIVLIRMGWKGQVVDDNGQVIVFDNLEKIVTGTITNDNKLIKEGMSGPSTGLNKPVATNATLRGEDVGTSGAWSYMSAANDQPADWDKLNPNTVADAVEWALSRKTFPAGMCEKMVTMAYGYAGGYPTAKAHADAMTLKSGTPPKGALVFHATKNPAQHVCLSVGGGYIVSTDFDGNGFRSGSMSVGPITAIDKWGPRRGWSAPIFKRGK